MTNYISIAFKTVDRHYNDNFVTENHLEEYDDHVEVNGVLFNKPFVEKPISAEDHNIYMYYPTSAGGKQLKLLYYPIDYFCQRSLF